jgi:hypothetical protein
MIAITFEKKQHQFVELCAARGLLRSNEAVLRIFVSHPRNAFCNSRIALAVLFV